MPPERRTIDAASQGDPRAIDELLVEYLPALQAFVRLRAGNVLAARESTSDVVQSLCRELLTGEATYRHRDEAGFKNWLFTAAANKLIDRQRFHRRGKRDVQREIATPDEQEHGALLAQYATLGTPSREVMGREAVERIEAAFAQLPEAHREAITLSRIAGLTYAEIGRETGKSDVAVRGLVARGLARLAELLGPDHGTEDDGP